MPCKAASVNTYTWLLFDGTRVRRGKRTNHRPAEMLAFSVRLAQEKAAAPHRAPVSFDDVMIPKSREHSMKLWQRKGEEKSTGHQEVGKGKIHMAQGKAHGREKRNAVAPLQCKQKKGSAGHKSHGKQ